MLRGVRTAAVLISTALLAQGCGSVGVQKVPTPSQYYDYKENKYLWTVDDQKRADAMEGIRFYLPRPFVNVFESFPVATDVYLGKGRVSPDGKFVTIDVVQPVSTRDDFERSDAANAAKQLTGVRVATDFVVTTRAKKDDKADGVAQAGDLEELRGLSPESLEKLRAYMDRAESAADKSERLNTDTRDAEQRIRAASTEGSSGKTGVNKRSVTNDNSAFAYQPLRGNFDIAYLPDFDEQYVVSSKANLGNVEFQLNLGQGWSLQGFQSLTDNSEVNKRVFDLIDTSMKLAKTAAGGLFGNLVPMAGVAMSGEVDSAPGKLEGTEVALKIVIVHYAARGLYPVIKPRELMHRAGPGLVVNLQAPGGAIGVTEDQVRQTVKQLEEMSSRTTIPVYPYQYISFNTFRYMAIEVLSPAGAPFGTLYDKTGTTGEPGNAQATPPTTNSAGGGGSGGGAGGGGEAVVQSRLNALAGGAKDAAAAKLQPPAKDALKSLTLQRVSAPTGEVHITWAATLVPGATALTAADEAAITEAVKDLLEKDAVVKNAIGTSKLVVKKAGAP